MQKSSVKVEILFSFKGEKHTPSTVIGFDQYLQKNQPVPEFFHLVARENNIGEYSYEYEVMEMGHFKYSDATGLAVEFCQQDHFDLAGFIDKWKEEYVLSLLSGIAKKYLDIDDLDENEAIKNALHHAHQLGVHSNK
ncbi:MAG: hypothetical protein HOM14_10340 [Gammaproteobacteria bacterium]|jgi:hypothetical protein|nr:hypothetical protein [Gammaproteobacteria bacterium]MBT6455149.1 hypothetical protein [Gammaproteobacteria bacterium]MBT6551741.1 hypothetical protein [Gammaproteobacteria bacterium]MBT6700568.1 hypothetical protein [Gammaproteobacteria bacterium]